MSTDDRENPTNFDPNPRHWQDHNTAEAIVSIFLGQFGQPLTGNLVRRCWWPIAAASRSAATHQCSSQVFSALRLTLTFSSWMLDGEIFPCQDEITIQPNTSTSSTFSTSTQAASTTSLTKDRWGRSLNELVQWTDTYLSISRGRQVVLRQTVWKYLPSEG